MWKTNKGSAQKAKASYIRQARIIANQSPTRAVGMRRNEKGEPGRFYCRGAERVGPPRTGRVWVDGEQI